MAEYDNLLAEVQPLAEVFGDSTVFGRVYLALRALNTELHEKVAGREMPDDLVANWRRAKRTGISPAAVIDAGDALADRLPALRSELADEIEELYWRHFDADDLDFNTERVIEWLRNRKEARPDMGEQMNEPDGIPGRLRYWARLSRDTELRREALRAAHLIEVQGRAITELRKKVATAQADAWDESAFAHRRVAHHVLTRPWPGNPYKEES